MIDNYKKKLKRLEIENVCKQLKINQNILKTVWCIETAYINIH